jgi:hypothetical protein
MDPLDHIKKLREDYERALDAAESRRVAYHEAVHDLYQRGIPLREIAQQLGLSHQRVHQIVSGEPPRKRNHGRVARGGAAAAVLLGVLFGGLRLAQAPPFAGRSDRSMPVAIVNLKDVARLNQLHGRPGFLSPTRLVLIVAGSSSCPSVPDTRTIQNPDAVSIKLVSKPIGGSTICTADSAGGPVVIAINPKQIDVHRRLTVSLYLPPTKRPSVYTVPPLSNSA